MKKCSFLTTSIEVVECFEECPFYNWEENEGVCPFQKVKSFDVESYNNYDLVKDEYKKRFTSILDKKNFNYI